MEIENLPYIDRMGLGSLNKNFEEAATFVCLTGQGPGIGTPASNGR